LSGLRRVL